MKVSEFSMTCNLAISKHAKNENTSWENEDIFLEI